MTTIHELRNPIDVFVKGVGYCKCIAWVDYGSQVNTMWKCRVYATGRVMNAYDDDIYVYGNRADGEIDKLPDGWETVKGNVWDATKKKEVIKRRTGESTI